MFDLNNDQMIVDANGVTYILQELNNQRVFEKVLSVFIPMIFMEIAIP